MNPITFSRQIDRKSYIQLVFEVIFTSRLIKIIYSISLLVILLMISSYGFENTTSNLIVSLIATGVIIYPFRIFLLANYKYNSSPFAGQTFYISIDDNGMQLKNDVFNSQISWSAVTKITQNKNWVFVWHGKSQYSFFKRDSISEQDLKEIKKTFYSNKKKTSSPSS